MSLIAYTAPRRSHQLFAAALLCQALAQLAKGSAVVLPLLFLTWELGGAKDVARGKKPLLRRQLWLTASFLLGVAIFLVQFKVATRAGVVVKAPDLTLLARIGGIIRTFNAMLVKVLLPVDLTYDYDIPWPSGLPPFSEWLLPLAVVLMLALLAWQRRWQLFTLSLLPLLTLAPYLNIIPLRHNVSGQIVFYDHYLLFFLVACVPLLSTLLVRVPPRWQRLAAVSSLLLALVWSACGFRLYGFWKNRETLYGRVIHVSPDLPKGYMFLGRLYFDNGRYEEAKPLFHRLLATKAWFPAFGDALRYLGDCYAFTGDYAQAEEAYRRYLKVMPRDISAMQNLSSALISLGKLSEAEEVILGWLAVAPDDPSAQFNLQLVRKGRK